MRLLLQVPATSPEPSQAKLLSPDTASVKEDAAAAAPLEIDQVPEDFIRPEVRDEGAEQAVEAAASDQQLHVESSSVEVIGTDTKADVTLHASQSSDEGPEVDPAETEETKVSPSDGENLTQGESEQYENVATSRREETQPGVIESEAENAEATTAEATTAGSKRRGRTRRTAPEPAREADSTVEEPKGRRSLRKRTEKPEAETKKRKTPEPKENPNEPSSSRIRN